MGLDGLNVKTRTFGIQYSYMNAKFRILDYVPHDLPTVMRKIICLSSKVRPCVDVVLLSVVRPSILRTKRRLQATLQVLVQMQAHWRHDDVARSVAVAVIAGHSENKNDQLPKDHDAFLFLPFSIDVQEEPISVFGRRQPHSHKNIDKILGRSW